MFCASCGRHLEEGALYCCRCGARTDGKTDPIRQGSDANKSAQIAQQGNNGQHSQEWLVVLLLCIFLGMLGVHSFYTKQNKQGVLILVCTVLGCVVGFTFVVSAVACVFDFARILKGTYKYGDGRILV